MKTGPKAKMFEAWGEQKTLREWLLDPRCKATSGAIYHRIYLKWSMEDALSTPVRDKQPDPKTAEAWKQVRAMGEAARRPAKLYTAFGESKSLKQWALDPRYKGNSYKELWTRMHNGWDFEKAIIYYSYYPSEVVTSKNLQKCIERHQKAIFRKL